MIPDQTLLPQVLNKLCNGRGKGNERKSCLTSRISGNIILGFFSSDFSCKMSITELNFLVSVSLLLKNERGIIFLFPSCFPFILFQPS